MKKSVFLPSKRLAVALTVIIAGFGFSGNLQAQSSEKQLLTYSFPDIVGAVGTIDQLNYTVTVTVPFSTDVTNLKATFTVSQFATVTVGVVLQVSGTTVNNFTNPVIYTVTAQNLSTRNYTVTVVKAAARTGRQLLTFRFNALVPDVIATINEVNHTVTATVPFTTDVTTLVATFTVSDYATVTVGGAPQTSGVTPNNFTNMVVYRVTAENGTLFQDYEVTVTKTPASTLCDITAFSFNALDPDVIGTIDQVHQTINLTVPFATNVTTLVATFTNSPFSNVTIGGNPQVSSTTVNDFTNDLTYRVTSQSGAIKDYLVHVTKANANAQTEITSFKFEVFDPDIVAVINQNAAPRTITLTVPFGTDVTNLVATFTSSSMSTVWIGANQQTSGVTANNFTNPVNYTCRAENGATAAYTVTVNITPASPANQILTFSFAVGFDPDVVGVINQTAKTIALTVPFSTDVTTLVPTFTASTFATVWVGAAQQTSGVTANNFTNPVVYICRAQDGSQEIYTVTVTKAATASTAKQITSFRFNALEPDAIGVINEVLKTITVYVPNSTNVTNLVATFILSPLAIAQVGAVLQTSGTTPNDFTAPVTYKVTAENLSTQDYVVTVVKSAATTGRQLLTFRFDALNPDVIGTINEVAHTVTLTVPFGTDRTALVATFTVSPNATVNIGGIPQVSGTTANNFTAPQTYVVVSESGVAQNYVVTVNVTPASTAKALLAFSFNGLNPPVAGIINETAKTVNLVVPYGTNVTNLVATFTASTFATVTVGGVPQVSGTTPNDFTVPLAYLVTAQDGVALQEYAVIVTISEASKQFLTFSLAGTVTLGGVDNVNFSVAGTVNNVNRTIVVNVPFSEDKTSLTASFTLTAGTSAWLGGVAQVSGTTENNFTAPRTYTLLAADGSTTTYLVSVNNNTVETLKQILTFILPNLNPAITATVNEAAKTITAQLPFGVSNTALVAAFTTTSQLTRVKVANVMQVSGTTVNNFTNPVIYNVYAEDNSMVAYTVTITMTQASSAKDITYFAFQDLEPDVVCTIDQVARTITGTVPNGTNRGALRAFFTNSPLSVVRIQNLGIQQSGVTINDFRTPLIYEVVAQDLSVKLYTVNIYEGTDVTKPIVSNAAQTVSNVDGSFALIRSNEATGKVYMILETAVRATVADLEAAVAAGVGRSHFVTAANVDIPLSTFNLINGNYITYAIDAAGNKSDPGPNKIIVVDQLAPTVSVDAQTISNANNHFVPVTSSDPSGTVYLILEGEPQSTPTQMNAAIAAKKGARGLVLQAGVPVNISVYQLVPGNYHAYAMDIAFNRSNPSTNVVVITEASRSKSITAYSFNGLTPPAIGQIVATDITVVVRVGTNVTALVATYTVSPLTRVYVGNVQQTSGVTPNNFTNPVIYTVEAEDGSTLDYTVTVTFNTGIGDYEWANAIRAFPNPFSDHLTLEMPKPADRIMIMNTLGQTVADIREPNRQTVEVSTGSWNEGIYIVRYIVDDKLVGIQKLIRD